MNDFIWNELETLAKVPPLQVYITRSQRYGLGWRLFVLISGEVLALANR
jgi:hypothetical protein